MSDITSLPSSDQQSSLGRRSRWRVLLWLGAAFLLLLRIIPISWGVIRWRTNQEIAAELARIRAAGEPASFEDVVNSIPPLAPEKDCTRMYDQVFTSINSQAFERRAEKLPYLGLEWEDEPVPPPGEKWPGLAEAETFIEAEAYNIAMLDKAARLGGGCRFPLTARDFADVGVDRQIFKSRRAAQLLQLRSDVAAHRKDTQVVFDSLVALGALIECLAAEPDSVPTLVRCAVNGCFVVHMQYMLGEVAFSDEHLAALQLKLRDIDYSMQLHSAYMTERLFGAQAFSGTSPEDDFQVDPDSTLAEFFPRRAWWWRFTSHADAFEYWRTTRRICDACQQSDVAAARRAVLAVVHDFDTLIGNSHFLAQRYFVTNSAAQHAALLATAVVRAEASNRAVDAFLACERYRLAHGAFPESLEQLVPDFLPTVPTDPFAEAPLRYLRESDGIVVYSVGADGQDAGGKLWSFDDTIDDIGFRSHAWKRQFAEFEKDQQHSAGQIGPGGDVDFGLDDDVE